MPEGHVIHRLAQVLEATFVDTAVGVSSPQGRFAEAAALLDGRALRSTDVHGKHLLLGFGPEHTVHVHLGLYGRFEVHDRPAEPPRGAVRMRLQTPTAHADLRGPARCTLVTSDEVAALHDRLGPDPLRDDDPERFVDRLRRSASAVGRLLMDQTVAAGVGNIYRAEALFRAGINPMTPGREIPAVLAAEIWADLVALMRLGLANGRIDTVRAEHSPQVSGRPPRVDAHGGEVYVYRRAGQPCLICAHEVRTEVVAGRNLFWCPRCQPAANPVATR